MLAAVIAYSEAVKVSAAVEVVEAEAEVEVAEVLVVELLTEMFIIRKDLQKNNRENISIQWTKLQI